MTATIYYAGRRLLPIICLLLGFFAVSTSARADDLWVLEQRLRTHLLERVPSDTTVTRYQSSLSSEGSWSDIPYQQRSQTGWKPYDHLSRLLDMSKAYANPKSRLYRNGALRRQILLAFDYWTHTRPTSTNWWYNEIAVPKALGPIMVLMRPDLSTQQREAGLLLVKRGIRPRSMNSGTNTGANRVDRAFSAIYHGLISRNSNLVREGFLAITDTIRITTAEGIQPDYSFLQHGPQLYIGGYGRVFFSGTLETALLVRGTAFAFPAEKVNLLTDLLLNGTQWFIRGDNIDLTAGGRGISREGNTAGAAGFSEYAALLSQLGRFYRSQELKALQIRLEDAVKNKSARPAQALVGNKMFWRADIMVHHRPGFYSSVKFTSNRTLAPESGNGEGLTNRYLGSGVNAVYRTGNEYDDIAPVWNWRRLPGITVEQNNASLKPRHDWGVRGNTAHAGGVSSGNEGAVAFDYQEDNVSAKKSWFFFEDEIVALGAGIQAPNATAPVNTTLNQSLLNGPVQYRAGNATTRLARGAEASPAELAWVHHDDTGYFFFDKAVKATVLGAEQTGTWRALTSGGKSTPVTKDVFSLWIDHGASVQNGTYAYAIVPGLKSNQMDAWHVSRPIEILSNTTAAQAVRHRKTNVLMANFWNDTPAQIAGIRVNTKACVIVRRSGGFLDVLVSDPTQQNKGQIEIDIDAPVSTVLEAGPEVVATRTPDGKARVVASVKGSMGKTFYVRFRAQ